MDKTRAQDYEKKEYLTSGLMRKVIPSVLYCFCGYLSAVSQLPFGAYPFGIALLAAADRNAIFVLAGVAAAVFGTLEGSAAFVVFGIYIALLLQRVLVRLTLDADEGKRSLPELLKMLFCERVGYRVCSSALAAFVLSLIVLIDGGFLYYDLFGLLISTAVAPIATYFLSSYFSSNSKTRTREIGFAVLCAICTFGAIPLKIYGVSLAVAAGIFTVFVVCRQKGFLRGLVLSIIIGVIFSPTMIPIFAISALCYGIFVKFSTTLVTFSTLASALAYAFYLRGLHALDGIVGGILTACVAFSVYSRVMNDEKHARTSVRSIERTRCRVLAESELDGVRLADTNRRTAALSEGLASLSSFFEEMELKFPRSEEIREICSQAFDGSCTGCPERFNCRNTLLPCEKEKFVEVLQKNGKIASQNISTELSEKCGRLPDIIDEINYNFDIRFGYNERRDIETAEGERIEAYGYRAISALLARGMEDESEEYIADLAASSALCDKLSELECEIFGVLVYGKRRRRVYIKSKDRGLLDAALPQIALVVKESLGIELDFERADIRRSGRGEEGSVELLEGQRYAISSVKRSEASSKEAACGDSTMIFENEDGISFVCISDGMGSGRDAAITSELTVGFLQNMLVRGRVNSELVGMLNSFLRSRCDSSALECSATLDLLQFDTVSGEAVFYKCGAAPTYVCHGGNLFKLRSRTMPLGILQTPDIKELRLELCAGDLVAMMSDGVTGGRDDCPYLFDLLRQNAASPSDQRTADLIMKYARSQPDPDDSSVLLVRVVDFR